MIITADLANAVSKVNPIFLEGTLNCFRRSQVGWPQGWSDSPSCY